MTGRIGSNSTPNPELQGLYDKEAAVKSDIDAAKQQQTSITSNGESEIHLVSLDISGNDSSLQGANANFRNSENSQSTAENNLNNAIQEESAAQNEKTIADQNLSTTDNAVLSADNFFVQMESQENTAQTALAGAVSNVNSAQAGVNSLEASVAGAQSELNRAQSEQNIFQEAWDGAKNAINRAIDAAKSAFNRAVEALNNAKNKLSEALKTKVDKEKAFDYAKGASQEAKGQLETKKTERNKAQELAYSAQTILDAKTGAREVSKQELDVATEIVRQAQEEKSQLEAKELELQAKKTEIQEKYDVLLADINNVLDGKQSELQAVQAQIAELQAEADKMSKEIAVESELDAKLASMGSELKAQNDTQGLGGSVASLFGGGVVGKENDFLEKQSLLEDAIKSGDPAKLEAAYKAITGEDLTPKALQQSKEAAEIASILNIGAIPASDGTSVDRNVLNNRLKEQASLLADELEAAINGQGKIGQGVGFVNNFLDIGTNEDEARAKVAEYRNLISRLDSCKDPNEYAALYKAITGDNLGFNSIGGLLGGESKVANSFGAETIFDYKESQLAGVDGVCGAVSGITAVVAVATAPLTGGASLALAVGVGAALNSGLKATDGFTSDRDYSLKEFGRDVLSGGVAGASGFFSLGAGTMLTNGLTSTMTKNMAASTAEKWFVQQGIKTGANFVSETTQGVLDSGVTAASNYMYEVSLGDREFNLSEFGSIIGQSALWGGVMGGGISLGTSAASFGRAANVNAAKEGLHEYKYNSFDLQLFATDNYTPNYSNAVPGTGLPKGEWVFVPSDTILNLGKGNTFDLDLSRYTDAKNGQVITVGREAQIQVPDDFRAVSRMHMEIQRYSNGEFDGFYIKDVSTYGTTIGTKAVQNDLPIGAANSGVQLEKWISLENNIGEVRVGKNTIFDLDSPQCRKRLNDMPNGDSLDISKKEINPLDNTISTAGVRITKQNGKIYIQDISTNSTAVSTKAVQNDIPTGTTGQLPTGLIDYRSVDLGTRLPGNRRVYVSSDTVLELGDTKIDLSEFANLIQKGEVIRAGSDLKENNFFIGMDDPRVSGKHLVFEKYGDGFIVMDMNSKYGTTIGTKAVQNDIPIGAANSGVQLEKWISLENNIGEVRVGKNTIFDLDSPQCRKRLNDMFDGDSFTISKKEINPLDNTISTAGVRITKQNGKIYIQDISTNSTALEKAQPSASLIGNAKSDAQKIIPDELVRDAGNNGKPINQNYINASKDLREYFNSKIKSGEYLTSFEGYKNMMNEAHIVAYEGKNGNYRWYAEAGGGRLKVEPGNIRGEGTYRCSRPEEGKYVERIAKKYGDPYSASSSEHNKVRLQGINEKGLPSNIEAQHWYPNSVYLDDYYRQMYRTSKEAMELINSGAPKNQILSKIAEHYQYAANARPYGQINNSLFMNEVNTLLSKAGMSTMPHGMLDHAAQRLQPETFKKYFVAEYERTKLSNTRN